MTWTACVRASLSLGIALGIAGAASAQAPAISTIAPRAAAPGATTDVSLLGGNLAGASDLWTSFPGDAALSPDVPENGTKGDQVVYRLTLPADAPVGVHAVRVATPGGVSPLAFFVVDDLPSVASTNANVTPEGAQVIAPLVGVDGTIAALTRQYFKFTVAAGQKVSIEVVARRLGSALDPMIRIMDSRGRELSYCDDAPGLGGDAQIMQEFAEAGDYVLELRDIRYQGGYYRLRIGDFPLVSVPYPLGAKRGTQVSINFAGPQIDGVQPVAMTAPSDPLLDWMSVGAKRSGGASSGFATLALSDADEVLEAEPNDAADQGTRAALGNNVNGLLEKAGDVDRFVFAAKAGQNFTLQAVTRRLGSPADLFLRLLDPAGNQVAVAEDTNGFDGVIKYGFPADGDYTLLVEDLHRRGGRELAYRVETSPTVAKFPLEASADNLNVPAGGTAMVTVTAARDGYGGPIHLALADAPQGITAVPTVIGPGRNSAVMTVTAAADAKAGSVFPIRIVGTGEGIDRTETATIVGVLKATGNQMPWPTYTLTRATALGVAPKAPFSLRTEPPTITFGHHLSTTVKVIAERQEGYTEEIALAVTPDKDGLPAGITFGAAPIPAGQNEVSVTFSADDKAPLGNFTGVLLGSLKKGDATVSQPATGVTLSLVAPMTVAAAAGDGVLAKGAELKVKVNVTRNPALAAPVKLAFENLPAGVTASAAELAADVSEIEVTLTAAADAAGGKVENIAVQGTAMVGDKTLSAKSAPFALTVQ